MNDSAVINNFLGVGSFVNHSHHKEQSTGHNCVVDHLDPTTINPLGIESEQSKYDITHVSY